jgi:hypothetical protein
MVRFGDFAFNLLREEASCISLIRLKVQDMTYSLLDRPPEHLAQYVVVDVAYRALFVEMLVAEFSKNTPFIRTSPVPIDWVVSASNHPAAEPYEISMERIKIDSGELGNAHGVFYFAHTFRRG